MATQVAWTEGDVIRKLRLAFGWKLRDLHQHSGVSMNVLNRLELGRSKPKVDTLKRIAKAFDWTAQQILAAVPTQAIAVSADRLAVAQTEKKIADQALKKSSTATSQRRGQRR